MVDVRDRLCVPPSRVELERRWTAVREILHEARCEALLIQGANNFNGMGGHYRWLMGVPVASSYPMTAIFPRTGLATVVMHGGSGERVAVDDSDPAAPGVGLRFGAPSFPGVSYCGEIDAEIIAGELAAAGYRRVALLAPHSWYAGMTTGLQRLASQIEWVDVTAQVDVVKANKSAEEVALLRQGAAMQDAVLDGLTTHIQPGMRDFEVMAFAQYTGQLLGSEGGYFLGSSAPPGELITFRRRHEQGRLLREGDVMYVQCENSGPGGLITHAGRYFVLGKAPQQLQDMVGLAIEAQDFTMGLLQPGTRCAEIFEEYNAWMATRGQRSERRVHCHGQGYDVVEPPLIRQDETMTLEVNTCMGFHPSITSGNLLFTCSDNLFIDGRGAVERLHATPRQIFELG